MIFSMYKLINLLFIVFCQFYSAEGAEQDLGLDKAVQIFGEMARLVSDIARNGASHKIDSQSAQEELNRLMQVSPAIDHGLWLSRVSDAWDTEGMRDHVKKLRASFYYSPELCRLADLLSKSTWCGMKPFLLQGLRLSRQILEKDIKNHKPTFPEDYDECLLATSCHNHNNFLSLVKALRVEGFDAIKLEDVFQKIVFDRPWRK